MSSPNLPPAGLPPGTRVLGTSSDAGTGFFGWPLLILLALLLAFATSTAFVSGVWPAGILRIGAYGLLAACLIRWRGSLRGPLALATLCIVSLPLWGLLQLAFHTTASTAETRDAVLRWGALAAVFLVAQRLGPRRRAFLEIFLWFAAVLAALCVTQLFSSDGRVLWLFDTGHDEVYATFPSHNSYAQFVELALPIALWRALIDRAHAVWYALAGGLLYASVIGSTSRAGSILCTLELFAILAIGLIRMRSASRAAAAMLALVPALALAFTLVVGWQRVWGRFQQHEPYTGRREFLISALEMARDRPLAGFGLGTFPAVYQHYAVRDFSYYANHAHNDWAEFAADGGLPFCMLVLIPFVLAVPAAIRHPWALGLIAIMLHACVDYPFPRPAVSGWIFAILGLLLAAAADQKLAAGSRVLVGRAELAS